MDLFNFAEYIKAHINEGWDKEDIFPEVIRVTKNNGVEFTGIIFKRKDSNICPTIYLESYHEMYVRGAGMEEVMAAIRASYERSEEEADSIKSSFAHLEKDKDKVVLRLINYQKNKKLLEDAPYIPFNDLAISFRWIVKMDDSGMASALVTNADMKDWGLDTKELYKLASENSKRLFSYSIDGMIEKIKKLSAEYPGFDIEEIAEYADSDDMLYVLSNEQQLNGATCMLYPGVIESCAEIAGGSIYIIPSSIHEIIFINEKYADPDELKNTLKEANNSVVLQTDILSDNIYYYDRTEKKLTIA